MRGNCVILMGKWVRSITLIIFLCSGGAFAGQVHEVHVNSMTSDDLFVALHEASRRGDSKKIEEWSGKLTEYDIPSYVEYYRLKSRLQKTPHVMIRDFLKRYEGSAIADRLRNDWLLELGRAKNWRVFDEQYTQFELNDDTQVRCYALASKLAKGKVVAEEAKILLISPKDYGDGCQNLVAEVVRTSQWIDEDIWAQIRLTAEFGQSGVARRMARWVGVSDRDIVQAIDNPNAILKQKMRAGYADRQIYLIALGRFAKTNLEQARYMLLEKEKYLTDQERVLGWSHIALQAAIKLAPDALDDWHHAETAPLSLEGYQWRVRSTLRTGDWHQVRLNIERMPLFLRNEPTWIYWLGRSMKEEGDVAGAQKLFESIAAQPHFYGQLASEELGGKIVAYPIERGLSQAETTAVETYPGLRRALKFFELGLRFEGVREWNWTLRKMSDRQHLAAAEFARKNNALDRMLSTSDRTKTEMDFTQRFPIPFYDLIHQTTAQLGLDIAWVYGLIRQESRFVLSARSYVGASGLMQVMPETAKFVARKVGMTDFTLEKLHHIDTNIVLGSSYLNMISNDFGGSQLMASAAYNAGPGRLRTWRATLSRSMEGAIFAETIPFSETRGYVKNVLLNATYYAALLENRPQSLKLRLGVVTPSSARVQAVAMN